MNGMKEAMAMKGFAQAQSKALVKGSVWEQLSNRWDVQKSLANGANTKVPTDCIHKITGISMTENTRSITQTMTGRLKGGYVGGPMIAEGTETTPDLYQMQVYWNVWRKPYKMFNGDDPESNYQAWYAKAEQRTVLAKDYAAELRDLFYHQAMVDNGSEILTDNKFWQDHEVVDFQTAPVAKRLHPIIFYKGQTAAITRHATYATDIQNVSTALKAMGPTSSFDLDAAESIIDKLFNRVRPLAWKSGGQNVSYVVLLSHIQARQLQSDSNWKALMKDAETRGIDNRAISGILGVYRETLFISNMRSPVFNLSSSAASVSYMRPETTTADAATALFFGEQSITRTVKAAAGTETGTCEIAIGLGAGSIVCPLPMDLTYREQDKDYYFRKGFLVMSKEGHQRTDFKDKNDAFSTFGSLLYITATPALAA